MWKTYPLEEAAQAHADLEAHRNRGKIVLMP
ncbi:zinc-binding dehydrogenase [Streptomyces sp. AGS-58]